MGNNNYIEIKGARENNLKNVNVKIPTGKITLIYGPSGSGKSSLAFQTILAESKRRYLNSFPNSFKFFMDKPAAADVDRISPVLPVFGLPQINPVIGSRSTVADVSGITEMFQRVFLEHSKPYCPQHKCFLKKKSFEEVLLKKIDQDSEANTIRVYLPRDDYSRAFGRNTFPSRGFSKKENMPCDFREDLEYWEVVRFRKKNLKKSFDKIKELFNNPEIKKVFIFSEESLEFAELKNTQSLECEKCDFKITENLTLPYFSPYNAAGACDKCQGHGGILEYDLNKIIPNHNLSLNDDPIRILTYKRFGTLGQSLKKECKKEKISLDKPINKLPKKFWKILLDGKGSYYGLNEVFSYLESKKYKTSVRVLISKIKSEVKCDVCDGSRLSENTSFYSLNDKPESIHDLFKEDINSLKKKVDELKLREDKNLKKIKASLKILTDLGLGHLNPLRKTKTLSPGEYQRLLLVKFLSYNGTGSLFIFDEPSLGLDKKALLSIYKNLENLKKMGNTILIIDHNEFFMGKCDYYVEMGPRAGKEGGEILFSGERKNSKKIARTKNLAGSLLNSPKRKTFIDAQDLEIYGLKKKRLKIPENLISWVTGPSGSGKTSFIVKIICNEIAKRLGLESITGDIYKIKELVFKKYDDVVVISSDLNRFSSRSTVGTLTGFAPVIRKHFLKKPIAKAMGLKDGHFSKNSELGMCESCMGKGKKIIEMQFLEDIILKCEDCDGFGLKSKYAKISDGRFTVKEAFSLPLNEIIPHIQLTPKHQRMWDFLKVLNLDYLSLDRIINSLSGGERQRIFLLSKLEKKITSSLIVFENPSFGLSSREIEKMGELIQSLQDSENTVLIIDSNPLFEGLSHHKLEF